MAVNLYIYGDCFIRVLYRSLHYCIKEYHADVTFHYAVIMIFMLNVFQNYRHEAINFVKRKLLHASPEWLECRT